MDILKKIYEKGKEVLAKRSGSFINPELLKKPQQGVVPGPNNPSEIARQQSFLDSQGEPNKAESYPQGRQGEEQNFNMRQRNFHNHQQN